MILENSVDVIYRRDMVRDVYDCVSPSVEALTGYTPEEFMSGGLQSTVDRVHPDDREDALRAIRAVLESPEGRGGAEYRYRRKDGAYRWFSDHYMVTRDAGGRLLYWVGAVRDVTTLKEAEEALKRSRDELETKVAERTAQLSELSASLVMAEEAERERIGYVLHEDLQQVLVALRYELEARESGGKRRGAGRSVALDILDKAIGVTRAISADLLPPVLVGERLSRALGQLVGDMKKQHDLDVSLDASDAAEPRREPVRVFVYRAVRELLFNVVKHAGIRSASVRVDLAPDGLVRVEVSDAGRGFAPGSDGPQGLGLFRIRERAAHFGGSFLTESPAGGGARVTLLLPRD